MSRHAKRWLLWGLPAGRAGGGAKPGIALPTANLLYLFDPDAAYVFADAALTTPAADGGYVAGIKDRASGGYHLTQSGATTLRPKYRAGVAEFGGRPALEFDGGDYLFRALTAPILGNLSTYTLYVVFRSTGAAERYMVSEGSSASDTPWIAMDLVGSQGRVRPFHVGDGGAYSAPNGSATNHNNGLCKVFAFRRVGNGFYSHVNNWYETATPSTTSPGTTTTDRLCIGGLLHAAFGSGFVGQVALVAAYAEDNLEVIEPLLQTYFGMDVDYYTNLDASIWCSGDSKTAGFKDGVRDELGGFGFIPLLTDRLTTATGNKWRELRPRGGHDGYTVATAKNVIDADLAAITSGPAPAAVLISFGTNDLAALPPEATWKANYQYIIDAVHTAYPSTKIYLGKPVRLIANPPSTPVADTATLHGWIDDLLIANSGVCFEGVDETNLEGGDSYVTNFVDNLHPNHAGNTLIASLAQTILGY